MKTYSPKPRDIERRWYVLDASGAILGRLATQAATILRGKHKPIFAPHADTGDHVIVINAKDVTLSGGKERQEDRLPPLRLPGRPDRDRVLQAPGREARLRGREGDQGHAPAQPARPADGEQAPRLRRRGSPPRGAEAPGARARRVPAVERAARGGDRPRPAPKTRPEPKAPAAKPTTAKRTTATPPAKKTTAKRPTAKPTAKRTTAKATTAKRTTAKSTRPRRRGSEEDDRASARRRRRRSVAQTATGRRKEAIARVRLVPGTGTSSSTGARSTSTSRRAPIAWSSPRPSGWSNATRTST